MAKLLIRPLLAASVAAAVVCAWFLMASADDSRTHVLRKGETLSDVARYYYGDRTQVARIMEANGIGDPTRVQAGAKILVPAQESSPVPSARSTSEEDIARRMRSSPIGPLARMALDDPRLSLRTAVAVVATIALGAAALSFLTVSMILSLVFWVGSKVSRIQDAEFGKAVSAAMWVSLANVVIAVAILALLHFGVRDWGLAGLVARLTREQRIAAGVLVGVPLFLAAFSVTLAIIQRSYRSSWGQALGIYLCSILTPLVFLGGMFGLTMGALEIFAK